jgi:hypothetical protein
MRWATVLTMLLFARSASADDASIRAQALFDDARRLMEAQRYAEACPKFAASQKLDPGAGTLLNLADCYDKNGQTASAWATFAEAAAEAAKSGHPDWAAQARERGQALAPDLANLTVTAVSPPSGFVVERDGARLQDGEIGTAIPVDPGRHTVTATAPGHVPWSATVDVGAYAHAKIAVPPLAVDEKRPRAPDEKPTMPPPQRETEDPGKTQRTLGFALGAAGVAGVLVGSAFGLAARGTYDDARAQCAPSDVCTGAGVAGVDRAYTQATIATVAFVVGGALLAGGAVLFFTAPRQGTPRAIGAAW